MKTTLVILGFLMSLLVSCKTPTTTTVTSADGRKRTLPTPQKFVRFQGTDFTIKSITVKLPAKETNKPTPDSSPAGSPKTGVEAGIGEITFTTKFRDATDLAVILDNAQFRDAQNLIAAASTLSDAEFARRLGRLSDSQQKLDQLALIVSAKDSTALQKWEDNYFKDGQILDRKPVTNTALGLKQF